MVSHYLCLQDDVVRVGTNRISVSVHQSDMYSSDVAWGMVFYRNPVAGRIGVVLVP